ncbi:MAG: MATE family efflux transporter [Firmicutes bacterium]|nr:MATE family efflux transporter [Bacillota bacterium]
MSRERTITDFTSGSIMRHLLTFSAPLFLGNLLQALYNTVDSIWVGRFLGAGALGAVSLSFPIVFTLISLAVGLSMATTVLVSQHFGAGNTAMVRRTVYTSIAFLGVLGAVTSVIGVVVHRPLLRLVNTPPDVMPMAAGYLWIYSAGLTFTFLYNVLGAIYRGLGDSRSPVEVLAYATVLNMILDPLMIFGVFPFPEMRVAGAAWATVISQAFSVYLLLRRLGRLGYPVSLSGDPCGDGWVIDRGIIRLILRIGLPSGAQQTLVALSAMAVMGVVNSFGSSVLAAFGAGTRLDQFALMPSMSISLAVSTMVGQNIGAGRFDRVGETVRVASILAASIAAAVAVVALIRPTLLLALFTQDREVLTVGSNYLRIVGASYIPFALMFVANGALRGAGDTVPTMFNSLAALWLVRVPLAWVLSRLPSLGSSGIWLSVAAGQVVGMVLAWSYYLRGGWRKKAIAVRPREHASPADPEY